MKLVYQGKTKDVYSLDDGNYRLIFKDDVTATDGVFDPGANAVGLQIKGMGQANLAMSKMFFELLRKKGIDSHYLNADIENSSMDVLAAEPIGKGLEVICRYRAVGSFYRRYGGHINEGDKLDAYVEFTIKDDQRGDPLITPEGLEALGLLHKVDYEMVIMITKKIAELVQAELVAKGLELYDIKLEYGIDKDDRIILIDEISAGNMRVYREGSLLEPMELTKIMI